MTEKWECPICGRTDKHSHFAPELGKLLEEIWTARERPLRERIAELEKLLAEKVKP